MEEAVARGVSETLQQPAASGFVPYLLGLLTCVVHAAAVVQHCSLHHPAWGQCEDICSGPQGTPFPGVPSNTGRVTILNMF